jgi:hypothetical protein
LSIHLRILAPTQHPENVNGATQLVAYVYKVSLEERSFQIFSCGCKIPLPGDSWRDWFTGGPKRIDRHCMPRADPLIAPLNNRPHRPRRTQQIQRDGSHWRANMRSTGVVFPEAEEITTARAVSASSTTRRMTRQVNTSAFLGTNPADEAITPGLRVNQKLRFAVCRAI